MDKELKKGKKYCIVWRDHFSTDGWFSTNGLGVSPEVSFESLGYFQEENDHYYHFSRTIGKEGTNDCADLMSILKPQVISIKEVK